jgi:hypothetical protein
VDFFLERFFAASRARWWQLVAAVCIGALFGGMAASETGAPVRNCAPAAAGGAALGLLGGLFLVWVDAGQRCREARQDARLTVREKILVACLIVGFTLGAISMLCGAIMAVVRGVEFFRGLAAA